MVRPKKADRSSLTDRTLTLRLTTAEHDELQARVEKRQAELVDEGTTITMGSYVRRLIRRDLGMAAASTLAAPAAPMPAASSGENPFASPDPMPAARQRSKTQQRQQLDEVAVALLRLADGRDRVASVADLVRELAPKLDRRDVADALDALRSEGLVELRPESSPRLYPIAEQRLALPGPKGSQVFKVRIVGDLARAAAPKQRQVRREVDADEVRQLLQRAVDAGKATQTDLANAIGVDKSYLTRWKKGAATLKPEVLAHLHELLQQ